MDVLRVFLHKMSGKKATEQSSNSHIGPWRTSANGHLTTDANGDEKTDYSRWRLLDDRGRQTWHYLESDDENEKWPQSIADKYFLGLPTVLPLIS